MRFRLLVVTRLIGTWAAPPALLGGIGLLTGSWQALWLVGILCIASIPLVALASLACFVWARSVASHPSVDGRRLVRNVVRRLVRGRIGGDRSFADGIGPGSHAVPDIHASMANGGRQRLKSATPPSASQQYGKRQGRGRQRECVPSMTP
jgi:hypothetical protein